MPNYQAIVAKNTQQGRLVLADELDSMQKSGGYYTPILIPCEKSFVVVTQEVSDNSQPQWPGIVGFWIVSLIAAFFVVKWAWTKQNFWLYYLMLCVLFFGAGIISAIVWMSTPPLI